MLLSPTKRRKLYILTKIYFLGSQLPVDQNGYEYLPPDRVGFGDPLPERPLKTTTAYATPTSLQIQPVQQQIEYSPATKFSQFLKEDSQTIYSESIPDIYSTNASI